MRYTHYLLVTSVVTLWVTSLTLLLLGSLTDEIWARPWSIWLGGGPALLCSCWLLLWDHRTKALQRIEEMVESEDAGIERLASAVALALARERTTPFR